MTFTIKSKEVNGNYIAIEQDKFSSAFRVILVDKFGRIDRQNIYGTEEKAKRGFYRYCKVAKTF